MAGVCSASAAQDVDGIGDRRSSDARVRGERCDENRSNGERVAETEEKVTGSADAPAEAAD